MNKTLEAMKRVIAKRRARGASDKDIEQCKDNWLSIYRNDTMQAAINELK